MYLLNQNQNPFKLLLPNYYMNKKILFTGLALLVLFLFGQLYMLLLFPIFIILFSFPSTQNLFRKIKLPLPLKFILLGILIGILTEILAIINNLGLPAAEKALFHSNPLTNIILSLGYYIPLVAAWFFLLKKYRFKTSQIFILSGILGIFAEQLGAVFLSFNIFAWLYAFLVHGSIMAIPFFIAQKEFSKFKGKDNLIKYLLGIIPTIIAFIIGGLWINLLGFG